MKKYPPSTKEGERMVNAIMDDTNNNEVTIEDNVYENTYRDTLFDEMSHYCNLIREQYEQFKNMGVNVLKKIDNDNIKSRALNEMMDYITASYFVIDPDVQIPRDSLSESDVDTLDVIYTLLYVDMFNAIIPTYLNKLDYYFDKPVTDILPTHNNDSSSLNYEQIKNSLILITKDIFARLQKLRHLDVTIEDNPSYIDLLSRYRKYIVLLDLPNAEQLVNNYLIPVVVSNKNELIWRV